MGLLTEAFRRRAGVLRSANPLHPVLAFGPRAAEIVAGHEDLPHSCGKGSPFERMIELGAKGLVIGVDFNVFTFLHYVEDLLQHNAPLPLYAESPLPVTIVLASGEEVVRRFFPFNRAMMKVRNLGLPISELERRGKIKRDRIGATRLGLVAMADIMAVTGELQRSGRSVALTPGTPPAPPPGPAARARRSIETLRTVLAGRVQEDVRRFAEGSVLLGRAAAQRFRDDRRSAKLPALAREEYLRDREGQRDPDPGIAASVDAALGWLGQAQDRSTTRDGGFARHFSLIDGWAPSYPETTGYIIPTLIDCAARLGDPTLRERAKRALDWLVSIQMSNGAFQGGMVNQTPVAPVTFNTGQILIGLAAGCVEFEDPRYRQALDRAAEWLATTQDPDGCWRRFGSPFTAAGEKAYETHVSWGLFEAARVAPGRGYDAAGVANVRWALTKQKGNGWFESCCLEEPERPLTHTLGYVLKGVLEAHRSTGDASFLEAARKAGQGLMAALRPDGALPGRLDRDFKATVPWVCLTGSVQIAACWLRLYALTGKTSFLEAGRRANAFVRRTVRVDAPPDQRGGVKGSLPVNGGYGTYQYLNWAAKFFIDSNLAELDIQGGALPKRTPASPR
jgi:hypothetical protein